MQAVVMHVKASSNYTERLYTLLVVDKSNKQPLLLPLGKQGNCLAGVEG